jgi:antitoxin component of MazEF toxin-antitoxin module
MAVFLKTVTHSSTIESTCLIPTDMVGYTMSSVLEVKMINEGDNVRLVVPKSYFHQLGLEKGDTLLVTVEEERTRTQKKNAKTRARTRRLRHN